uniref:Uncharacterized protein n=2 Tax=Felidae TaxID=9681 RepID=A0A8C8X443_PANLE
ACVQPGRVGSPVTWKQSRLPGTVIVGFNETVDVKINALPGAGPFICACVSLSLRSHGDTLHAFPRDRPDPKTLDRGRPLRGGARPPGLSLPSHPPSD